MISDLKKYFKEKNIENLGGSGFLLKDRGQKYYVKFFSYEKERNIEVENYKLLKEKSLFYIPEIKYYPSEKFLLIEFIENSTPTKKSWQIFKEKLDHLHQQKTETFGLNYDNYIGGLLQKNTPSKSWPKFYLNQRLKPYKDFFDSNDWYIISKALDDFVSSHNPEPSLIHGDLWSGNLLFHSNQEPVIIDFCPSYSIPPMDHAMMQLFSGFDYPYPIDPYLGLWQAYFLAIHCRLFGSSYKSPLQRAIQSLV